MPHKRTARRGIVNWSYRSINQSINIRLLRHDKMQAENLKQNSARYTCILNAVRKERSPASIFAFTIYDASRLGTRIRLGGGSPLISGMSVALDDDGENDDVTISG